MSSEWNKDDSLALKMYFYFYFASVLSICKVSYQKLFFPQNKGNILYLNRNLLSRDWPHARKLETMLDKAEKIDNKSSYYYFYYLFFLYLRYTDFQKISVSEYKPLGEDLAEKNN